MKPDSAFDQSLTPMRVGLSHMLRQIADELDIDAETAPCSEAEIIREAATEIDHLKQLLIVVNNAAQVIVRSTVRRKPPKLYTKISAGDAMPITSLPVRCRKILNRNGITTPQQLAEKTEQWTSDRKNCGANALAWFRSWLNSHGLEFAQEDGALA